MKIVITIILIILFTIIWIEQWKKSAFKRLCEYNNTELSWEEKGNTYAVFCKDWNRLIDLKLIK